jgi:predicted NAD-dependent protein-ADP-ribosyltransferase YbiA (DUF1768 family)
MVQSKLCDIVYDETTEIHDDDDDIECNTYSMSFPSIDNVQRNIVFGNKKHDYEHKGVIYFPIYLVVDDEVKDRIGVHETYLDELPQIYDDDDEIDAQQVNPLLYDFVTKPYLQSFQNLKHVDECDGLPGPAKKEDEDEVLVGENLSEKDLDIEVIDDESDDDLFDVKIKENNKSKKNDTKTDEDLFENDVNHSMPNMLNEESKSDAKENKKRFKESSNNNWMQRFMKNNNYNIKDNEGGGDCFFAVVRDAYKQIGRKTTIPKLRNAIANKVTKQTYEEYNTIYLDVDNEIGEMRKEIEKQEAAIKQYKQRIKHIKTKQEHLEIIEQAKECAKIVKDLKNQLKESEDFLRDHFGFMKHVRNFEEFVDFIKSERCFAEPWIVNILESILNAKFIVFSEEAFQSNDLDSVLYCGDKIPNVGSLRPEFYIMVCNSKKNYKLVSYKQKHMLTYREIPYDVKSLIVNKCMEKNAGVYNAIEDFQQLKEQLHIDDYESDEEPDYDLYDADIEFRFYVNSRDAYPGEGSGEKMPKKKMNSYKSLAKIKDWRKKLDHSYAKAPFVLDGRKWASVEHYYNAAKFKKGHPEFFFSFSLDSDSDISKKVSLAIENGKKNESKRIDPDFYGERSLEEKKKAIEAKFSQHEELKKMLLSTAPAKLVHFKRGSSPETDVELMEIRRKLAM